MSEAIRHEPFTFSNFTVCDHVPPCWSVLVSLAVALVPDGSMRTSCNCGAAGFVAG